MFDDWKFSHNFDSEHFKHALGNFIPIGDSTDVVQHRRRFAEWYSCFDLFDELHAAKIHIIVSLCKCALIVNSIWLITIRVVDQLTGSEKECEVLVIVKAPNAM